MLYCGAACARGRWQVPTPDAGDFWLGPWMPGGEVWVIQGSWSLFQTFVRFFAVHLNYRYCLIQSKWDPISSLSFPKREEAPYHLKECSQACPGPKCGSF